MATSTRKPQQADRLFRSFADRTRLRLLRLMSGGEVCVCDLTAVLAMPQPKISRHLAYLRSAGLVLTRRQGTWIYYRLAPPQTRLHARLFECLACCFDGIPQMARDERALERRRRGLPCVDDGLQSVHRETTERDDATERGDTTERVDASVRSKMKLCEANAGRESACCSIGSTGAACDCAARGHGRVESGVSRRRRSGSNRAGSNHPESNHSGSNRSRTNKVSSTTRG